MDNEVNDWVDDWMIDNEVDDDDWDEYPSKGWFTDCCIDTTDADGNCVKCGDSSPLMLCDYCAKPSHNPFTKVMCLIGRFDSWLYHRYGLYYRLTQLRWDLEEWLTFRKCMGCKKLRFASWRASLRFHSVEGQKGVTCDDCWVKAHPNGCGCGMTNRYGESEQGAI